MIHNGQLSPIPSPTPRSLRGITARVIEASGRAAVVGDLFSIYGVAQREQASFHWVTIPEGVEIPGTEVFDPVKMRSSTTSATGPRLRDRFGPLILRGCKEKFLHHKRRERQLA